MRTRRASVMSLVRDMVAALGANDDPLLGLFGAFAYDLVFQIELLDFKSLDEVRAMQQAEAASRAAPAAEAPAPAGK